MTAKELFKKLGWEYNIVDNVRNYGHVDIYTKYSNNVIEYRRDGYEKEVIRFYTNEKVVEYYSNGYEFEEYIYLEGQDFKIIQAINKQIEELGWLNN